MVENGGDDRVSDPRRGAMKLLTPSRVIAAAALALAALSFGVAYASTGGTAGQARAGKKACVHGTALLERNKSNVVAYYTMAFNDKRPREAVDRFVGFDKPGQDLDGSGEPHLYIQHNPLARSGAPAFIAFVEFFTGMFPDIHIDIRRVVAECDLVVTHGLITGAPAFTALGSKVVDIFRLDENGKIVEHWDVLAAITPLDQNQNKNPEV
jgi:predicted SnoaL-like aldol condensation-catalyzing enzyme